MMCTARLCNARTPQLRAPLPPAASPTHLTQLDFESNPLPVQARMRGYPLGRAAGRVGILRVDARGATV